MKKVLIISPYFPPVNAADMHRIRTSLPYLNEFGYTADVVTVDPAYCDLPLDCLLLESIPKEITVYKVKAFNKKWTSKIGLGSIALRSLWYYFIQVNKLLKTNQYDLIYFSTTQYPVCILGRLWKRKFNVPYVIDMQDPWHSRYYLNKPKEQRPAKYWFSYRLNKVFESFAMKNVGGLIGVSENYITDLKDRYKTIANVPSATITFGSFDPDLSVAVVHKSEFEMLLDPASVNIVYIGRGGNDMQGAIGTLFNAYAKGSACDKRFRDLRFYFLGTSYAPSGKGKETVMPVAFEYGLDKKSVVERTDRISYYHTLLTLLQADALFIPGSDDAKYTASKIYPYLLVKKPLLAIFNDASSALKIMKNCGVEYALNFEEAKEDVLISFFDELLAGKLKDPSYDPEIISENSARKMTLRQCKVFDEVINE